METHLPAAISFGDVTFSVRSPGSCVWMARRSGCGHRQLQACRWLLLSLGRLEGNQLVMTHELIAGMLGVHREGVTEGAHLLKRDAIIDYQRGHITVLDLPRMEALSVQVLYGGQTRIRQALARVRLPGRYRNDAKCQCCAAPDCVASKP